MTKSYVGLFDLTGMTVKNDNLTKEELEIALKMIDIYGINYVPVRDII